MKEFDFNIFNTNIQRDIDNAHNIVNEIEMSQFYGTGDREKNEMNELLLSYKLNEIQLKITFALEYIGLEKMLSDFKMGFAKYENKLSKLSYISPIDVLSSEPLSYLYNYISAITSHIKLEETKELEQSTSIKLLEQILKGTPKIITDRNIVPRNENEVRNEIYKVLIHIFPSTLREVPIPKVFKTYKPDIGIKELKCAIEYKFVDSEEEAKKCLGGIYEDMKGYEGSNDWKLFFAVIYMTDHFFTPLQVKAEFSISKAEYNWKPIVVFGHGKRRNKRQKAK